MSVLHPRRPLVRAAGLLACASVLLLAACSVVRLAYNQSDTVVYLWLDRAFDLDHRQGNALRRNVGQWFDWHRHTQLPVYAKFLERAEGEAKCPITPALACERRAEIEGWSRTALDHAIPMLARTVRGLDEGQLQHLSERMDKSNEEFRDKYLDEDPADRREAATDFAVTWAERFYGDLDDSQRALLERQVAALPLNAQDVYDERVRLQRELLQAFGQIVRGKATQEQAEATLRDIARRNFDPPDPERHARLDRWKAAGCQLTATLHNTTTAGQRAEVAKRFDSWSEDLALLSTE